MAEKRDYYEVLGLQKGASEDEIKKAFRQLAKKYRNELELIREKDTFRSTIQIYFDDTEQYYERICSVVFKNCTVCLDHVLFLQEEDAGFQEANAHPSSYRFRVSRSRCLLLLLPLLSTRRWKLAVFDWSGKQIRERHLQQTLREQDRGRRGREP